MKYIKIHKIVTYLIATVWLVNGLFCKILNFVPRHEQIIAQILGETYSRELAILIGFSEVIMTFWILSGYKKRWNVITQISVITVMNSIEFVLVPNLLLWAHFNSVFALLFIAIIYYNEFYLNRK